VKARVVDFSEIPWFIGCSEDEDFEGESWIAQCEILQATLLGGGPRYEGIPPNGPEDVQPNLFQFLLALVSLDKAQLSLMMMLLMQSEAIRIKMLMKSLMHNRRISP